MADIPVENTALSIALGDGSLYMDFLPDENDALPGQADLEEFDILAYELRRPETLGGGIVAEVVNWAGSGLVGGAATLGLQAAATALRRTRAKDLASVGEAWARVCAAIGRARGTQPEPSLRFAVRNPSTGEWTILFTVDQDDGRALVLGNGAVTVLDFMPPPLAGP